MIFLKFVNKLNNRWNQIVFWVHDITTRWGVGHTTVWFYDTFRWDLHTRWQLLGGKTHEQYMLEHELYIAQHQAQYYANLAYDYQRELLEQFFESDNATKEYESELKEIKLDKLNAAL
jgi:hypothetical protein